MTAEEPHATAIRRAFTTQAGAFEDPARNRLFTIDARWVFDALPVAEDDLVLDVAAGTGLAARQLAAVARTVIALDATEAMLERGLQAARDDGAGNVVFMHHDLTEPLPFLAGSFDVAVCRFALHHLQHPGLAVAEMARVLRPGGHAALVDMIAAPNATVAAQQDRIETLRDPSHTRMFSGEGLRELAAGHGLEVVAFDAHPVQRPVGPWLEQAQTPAGPAADIESELLAEARRGGTPTGMSPELRDGELWFTQTFASLIAQAR